MFTSVGSNLDNQIYRNIILEKLKIVNRFYIDYTDIFIIVHSFFTFLPVKGGGERCSPPKGSYKDQLFVALFAAAKHKSRA